MQKRLAIIDWGIGGIGVYEAVKQGLGDIPIIYFSDTGVTPYGKMTRGELASRLNTVIAHLKTLGATHLAIGCNAASTAIGHLDLQGMKVEGMIDSGVSAALRLKPKRLGVIGGRRTVVSGVYRRAFAAQGLAIEQRVAQPLSGLIEGGDTGSAKLRSEAKQILAPIKTCSHILLACTHYPAIAAVLQDQVSDHTVLIDPSAELVKRIVRWKIGTDGTDNFLTTGDPAQMKRSAKNAFGVTLRSVKHIAI